MADRPEVSLRAFQEGDAPAVHRWFNNPEATKSLTFALRFRAADRTLTAAEATEAKQGAVRLAGERSGATLRE